MSQNKKNIRLAINLLMIVAGMAMLAYASVPLYRLFCQTTGFGGTPMIAEKLPDRVLERKLTIRFDTNIDRNLNWEFGADQTQMKVKVGENGLASFHAKSTSDKTEYGMAMYNVTPEKAARYFNKVQCFCFEKQGIAAGKEVVFPISFFIDPEFASDPFMDDVDTITLSYTFYEYKEKK